jgi:hypothetical protein
MAGAEPKLDRDLLGRVAALTPGQQRWLRTVLQSVVTMDPPTKRTAEKEPYERPRRAGPPAVEPEPKPKAREEPRRTGLDELLSGEGVSEEDYPELADDLKGISGIADLLREGGRERRSFGEELMRLIGGSEGSEASDGEDEEEEDEDEDTGARLN